MTGHGFAQCTPEHCCCPLSWDRSAHRPEPDCCPSCGREVDGSHVREDICYYCVRGHVAGHAKGDG